MSTSMMTMDASGGLKSVQHQQHTPSGPHVLDKGPAAAKWTLADDQSMLDVLLFAREKGDIASNGHFKMQTWQDVVYTVAASTTAGGRKDVENCKSRLQRLRKDYRAIKSIKEQPGFKWSGEQCMLVASEETWDSYIKAHAEQHKYRTLKFPQYDAIATLGDDELPEGHAPVKAIQPRPVITRTPLEDQTPAHTPPPPPPLQATQQSVTFPPPPHGQTATFIVPFSQRAAPGPSGPTFTSLMQSQPPPQQGVFSSKRTTPSPDDNRSEIEEEEDTSHVNGARNGTTQAARRAPGRPRKKPRLENPKEATPSISMGPPSPPKSPSRSLPPLDLTAIIGESVRHLKGPLDDYVELQRPHAIHRNQLPPQYPETLHLPSRHRVNTAVILVLDQELNLSPEEKARLIHIFGRDIDAADRFILFCYRPQAAAVRTAWIQQLLAQNR
ncbi:hypothetical protein SCHPADRAFT_892230 [Schizopora paradoxa]|uniref:Myb/SANT-like domain-containing protein n=1 Tax=Schizopora paradoxa TaxID=27342 RepID=A0A0H2RMA3_9AGAM|nr:hypothetical protein SCHPADRAFT_892230 [Schizopora paradoxa]